jgi:hypothetical protein
LEGRSTEYWYVGIDSVAAVLRERARSGHIPTRFRCFADLGNESRVVGEWRSLRDLPVWRESVTNDFLQSLDRAASLNSSPAD